MKILITGSNGQLGNEMRLALQGRDAEVFYTDIENLDITKSWMLDEFVDQNKITHIVNCAAFTAVDRAEVDRINAAKINIDAVGNIANAALRHGIRVIHISTDYVFDGRGYQPYQENMPALPATVYGKTKFAGEQTLTTLCRDAIVLRTAWLYSSFGNNFVKTMIKYGREKDEMNVVFDQIGSPTYAADLAKVIVEILFDKLWTPGIYHFTNEGVCSWYDFAITIHRMMGIECKVHPVSSSEYKSKTPRPFYSVLNKRKIKSTFDIEIPHWMESLQRCIEILKEQE